MSTQPIEAHHIKKGSYVMLKSHPCKIAEVKTSKTGKHGHAKCNITGIDVLTNRKYNDVAPGHLIFNAFELRKDEFDLLDLNSADGTASLLSSDNNESTFNFDPSDEVMVDLQKEVEGAAEAGVEKYFTVTVVTAPEGEGDKITEVRKIVEFKETKE